MRRVFPDRIAATDHLVSSGWQGAGSEHGNVDLFERGVGLARVEPYGSTGRVVAHVMVPLHIAIDRDTGLTDLEKRNAKSLTQEQLEALAWLPAQGAVVMVSRDRLPGEPSGTRLAALSYKGFCERVYDCNSGPAWRNRVAWRITPAGARVAEMLRMHGGLD